MPFCVWQTGSLTTRTRLARVAKVSITSSVNLLLLFIVKSESTWLHSEQFKFTAKKYFCCIKYQQDHHMKSAKGNIWTFCMFSHQVANSLGVPFNQKSGVENAWWVCKEKNSIIPRIRTSRSFHIHSLSYSRKKSSKVIALNRLWLLKEY